MEDKYKDCLAACQICLVDCQNCLMHMAGMNSSNDCPKSASYVLTPVTPVLKRCRLIADGQRITVAYARRFVHGVQSSAAHMITTTVSNVQSLAAGVLRNAIN